MFYETMDVICAGNWRAVACSRNTLRVLGMYSAAHVMNLVRA